MILRATTLFAKRLKIQSLEKYDGKASALEEWYAHQFTANRIQYLLLTNAYSLYSCVFPAKGVINLRTFADLSGYWLTEAIKNNGLGDLVRFLVIQNYETIDVFATNNRGVLGSMNDMINHAKLFILEMRLPPQEIAARLNDMPFKYLKYKTPAKVFKQKTLG